LITVLICAEPLSVSFSPVSCHFLISLTAADLTSTYTLTAYHQHDTLCRRIYLDRISDNAQLLPQ
jgi:hypothetical protein